MDGWMDGWKIRLAQWKKIEMLEKEGRVSSTICQGG